MSCLRSPPSGRVVDLADDDPLETAHDVAFRQALCGPVSALESVRSASLRGRRRTVDAALGEDSVDGGGADAELLFRSRCWATALTAVRSRSDGASRPSCGRAGGTTPVRRYRAHDVASIPSLRAKSLVGTSQYGRDHRQGSRLSKPAGGGIGRRAPQRRWCPPSPSPPEPAPRARARAEKLCKTFGFAQHYYDNNSRRAVTPLQTT